MKYLFMPVLAVLLCAYVGNAQSKKNVKAPAPQTKDPYALASTPAKAPAEVSTAFSTRYANIDISAVQWRKTASGIYIAVYNVDSMPGEAFFDPTGKWLKTKTYYTVAQLPEAVRTALEARLDISTVKRCVKLEMEGINPYYMVHSQATETDSLKEFTASENGVLREY
jgi:hypothetical protein